MSSMASGDFQRRYLQQLSSVRRTRRSIRTLIRAGRPETGRPARAGRLRHSPRLERYRPDCHLVLAVAADALVLARAVPDGVGAVLVHSERAGLGVERLRAFAR